MKVIIPHRQKPHNCLLYAVRSIERFLPGTEIVIVGDRPIFEFDGTFIHQPRIRPKLADALTNFLVGLKQCRPEDGAIWWMDDVFVVRHTSIEEMNIARHNGLLNVKANQRGWWRVARARTLQVLQGNQLPTYDFATHFPHVVNVGLALEVFDRYGIIANQLLWELVYQNHAVRERVCIDAPVGKWGRYLSRELFSESEAHNAIGDSVVVCSGGKSWHHGFLAKALAHIIDIESGIASTPATISAPCKHLGEHVKSVRGLSRTMHPLFHCNLLQKVCSIERAMRSVTKCTGCRHYEPLDQVRVIYDIAEQPVPLSQSSSDVVCGHRSQKPTGWTQRKICKTRREPIPLYHCGLLNRPCTSCGPAEGAVWCGRCPHHTRPHTQTREHSVKHLACTDFGIVETWDDDIAFVTSIAPHDIEKAKRAIDSWFYFQLPVVCVQTEQDMDIIGNKISGVEWKIVPDGPPFINDMAAVAIDRGATILLINSDIEIESNTEMFWYAIQPDRMMVGIRHHYSHTKAKSRLCRSGIDAFTITPEFAQNMIATRFQIGKPCWDYYMLLEAERQGVSTRFIGYPLFYHELHPIRWKNSHADMLAEIDRVWKQMHGDKPKPFGTWSQFRKLFPLA